MSPYPPHYRVAFASSRVLYRHSIPLPCGRATPGFTALHPPGERYRLTTFHKLHKMGLGCLYGPGARHVCRPVRYPTEPVPFAVLALEPKGRSSSALVTIRNPEASLTLSIPIISHSRLGVRLAFPAVTECLRPHRCQ